MPISWAVRDLLQTITLTIWKITFTGNPTWITCHCLEELNKRRSIPDVTSFRESNPTSITTAVRPTRWWSPTPVELTGPRIAGFWKEWFILSSQVERVEIYPAQIIDGGAIFYDRAKNWEFWVGTHESTKEGWRETSLRKFVIWISTSLSKFRHHIREIQTV